MYLVKSDSPPTLAGPGEEGELWIGGVGVAAGYLNRPDLTEQVDISCRSTHDNMIRVDD